MDYNKMTKKQLIKLLMAKEKPHDKTATDIYTKYLQPYGKEQQEYFIGLYMNGANDIISAKVLTIGLANRTLVHPREVFAPAIEQRATAVIVAHNHPSGMLTPSEDDANVTDVLRKAGNILGIKLLDHIVFSDVDYLSMAEDGCVYFG